MASRRRPWRASAQQACTRIRRSQASNRSSSRSEGSSRQAVMRVCWTASSARSTSRRIRNAIAISRSPTARARSRTPLHPLVGPGPRALALAGPAPGVRSGRITPMSPATGELFTDSRHASPGGPAGSPFSRSGTGRMSMPESDARSLRCRSTRRATSGSHPRSRRTWGSPASSCIRGETAPSMDRRWAAPRSGSAGRPGARRRARRCPRARDSAPASCHGPRAGSRSPRSPSRAGRPVRAGRRCSPEPPDRPARGPRRSSDRGDVSIPLTLAVIARSNPRPARASSSSSGVTSHGPNELAKSLPFAGPSRTVVSSRCRSRADQSSKIV